jgi:hypothetical protein
MVDRQLAVIEGEARDLDLVPAFVMSVAQAKQQLMQLQAFVREVMVKDEDYGVIPGTEKPTLFKAGAEKLNEIYGYATELETVNRIEDWQAGMFHYEVKCRLVSKRSGRVIAEGVGSCNSKEKRYADRWVFQSDLPDTMTKDEISHLKSKEIVSRKNGQKYTMYLWRNEDIFTLVNTILKMAKKRALVDATLSATRSSGIFTQDMEDIVDAPKPASAASMNRTPSQPEKPAPKAATPMPAAPPPPTQPAPVQPPLGDESRRVDLLAGLKEVASRSKNGWQGFLDWWPTQYAGTPETADVATLEAAYALLTKK